MLSSRPRERSDISYCHPDRESGANEWRDLWAEFGWVDPPSSIVGHGHTFSHGNGYDWAWPEI